MAVPLAARVGSSPPVFRIVRQTAFLSGGLFMMGLMPRIDLHLSESELETLRKEPGSVSNVIRRALGFRERFPGRPPKGAVEVQRALGRAAKAGLSAREAQAKAVAAVKPFGCPAPGCEFRSSSGAARCPDHGRTVV